MRWKAVFKRICLFFFPLAVIPFLSLFYDFIDSGVLGIIFSCVNESPWELMKPVFWACLFWWSLDLIWGVKRFKVFVKAKVICLILLCIACCISNTLFLYGFNSFLWWQPMASQIVLAFLFYFASNIVVKNMENTRGFALCVIMLAVMVGAVFCLTLYPPHNFLFVDKFLNTYGIVN